MIRLVRDLTPAVAALIVGLILLTAAGLGSNTLIVIHAALHTLWLVADTIARALGYLTLAWVVAGSAWLVWDERKQVRR